MLSSEKDGYLSIARLAELVKQNPILYEAHEKGRNRGFTSRTMSLRNSIWEAIGKDLRHPPDACRKRWKALRDSYVKSMKGGKSSQYRHILYFLDDHIDCKKNKPGNTKTSNKSDDEVSNNDKSNDDDDDIIGDDVLADATSDAFSSMFNKSLEETINKFTEPKLNAHQSSTFQHPNECPIEANIEERTVECSSSIIISNVVSLSTEQRNSAPEDLTELNNLKRKLDDSSQTEISNSKTLKTEDFAKEQLDIAVFFKEIGEYVTARFPLKKQMELRMKVLSLVTEAELELLNEEE